MSKKEPQSIAAKLRKAIAQADRRGISQADIARESGMSRSQVSRVASGATTPTLDTAERIAKVIGYRINLERVA